MTIDKEPYFMKDEKWYKFDEEEFRYVLTDEAPEKAVQSYNEYYGLVDSTKINQD